MTRPAPRVLAGGGFWSDEPPIDKGAAEEILACRLPDEAWADIVEAFHRYSADLALLDAPTPAEYDRALAKIRKGVGAAGSALKSLDKDRALLEALDCAALREPMFYRTGFGVSELVERLLFDLGKLELVLLLASGPPTQTAVQSAADAKIGLLRRVQKAVAEAGVDTRPPATWARAEEDAGFASPFVALVRALKIHPANSDAALVEWLRVNLSGEFFPV